MGLRTLALLCLLHIMMLLVITEVRSQGKLRDYFI